MGQFGERVVIVSLRAPCGRIKEGDDATLRQGDKGHRTSEKLLNSPRRSKAERAIRINVVISVPRNSLPCFEHFRNAVRSTQRHFDANRVAVFDTWESGRLEYELKPPLQDGRIGARARYAAQARPCV